MSGRREELLLFWSWFNTHSFRVERATELWTEDRFRYWLAFTLSSVLRQNEADWTYWLVCSHDLRELTDPLRHAITDPRVELVFEDECCARLANLPRADRYLVARLDSDDLYHPVTSTTLLKQQPTTPFLQFNQGFAMDVGSGDVLPWRSQSSPFYTHVYGEEIRGLERWNEPNHTTVVKSAQVLGAGHFVVSLHADNTSTTRARAAGPPFPTERGRTILGQFGIGGERSLDDLAANSRAPVPWLRRWRELEDSTSAWLNGSAPVPAIVLYRLVCELTAARSTTVIGGGIGAVLARHIDDPTESGTCQRHDVVFHDLASHPPGRELFNRALRAVRPTGLVVLAGVHARHNASAVTKLMAGVIADRYPEVERLAIDRDGSTCWLLGRVLTTSDGGSN